MAKNYLHLNPYERQHLYQLKHAGWSFRAIAKELGRSPSTLCDEWNRNQHHRAYEPERAQAKAAARRKLPRRPGKFEQPQIDAFVRQRLEHQDSPQQIAEKFKQDRRRRPTRTVSFQAIYAWIEKDRRQGGGLYKNLRLNHRKRRRPKGKSVHKARIANRVMIDQRPACVDAKRYYGDGEGDTVLGHKRCSSCLATRVERKTGYVQILLLRGQQSAQLNAAVMERFWERGELPRRTVTVDNGQEFAGHEALSDLLCAPVYFAFPGHCRERGLNENTKGLIRQYFPKGFDFDRVDAARVAEVENFLNNRPRKRLNYRTPAECMRRYLRQRSRRVGVRLVT